MKTKPTTQAGCDRKNARKPVKTLPKNVLIKRTSIKLRASTGKCVAKRTRDRLSPVVSHQKGFPGPFDKNKTVSSKIHAKQKKLTEAKLTNKLNLDSKKAMVKNKGIIKNKANRNKKTNVKKKVIKQLNPSEFVDIWAFVSIGKREASLNASMKVNILFEKHSPLKPPKTPAKKAEKGQNSQQDESVTNKTPVKGKIITEGFKNKRTLGNSVKELSCSKSREDETSKEKSCQDRKIVQRKNGGKKAAFQSKPTDSGPRKRKDSSYKISKEVPLAKIRKTNQKISVKLKSKVTKKVKKRLPSGHHLSNIIEKSPRQASLIAKAMIALEQEEDTVYESAARTQIYEWMELRPCIQTESRKIQWCNGLSSSIKGKTVKNSDEEMQLAKYRTNVNDDNISSERALNERTLSIAKIESESLHETLLRTLHHIGDSRLLKEYLRAQREDFQGSVDVEMCATPEKQKTSCPDPKKDISSLVTDEKLETILDKTADYSPVKPQPCRIVTPIPQFPASQRTSSVPNFLHSPVPQPIYSQHHNLSHPQPIKVTPYPASPGYVYQYTMEPLQSEAYCAPNPSSMSCGSSEVVHRDYSSSYSFGLGHMGRLGLDRRSVDLYQPSTYSASLHLPMPQIGFNYRAYYPTPIHALPQQTMPALQTFPVHQKYPLVQAPVITQHQINQNVGQLGQYQHSYPAYPPLANCRQNESCMPPPLPPASRRTQPGPLVPMRQLPPSGQSVLSYSPMEPFKSMNPVGVQPVVRSHALDFPPKLVHHHGNYHKQFQDLPSCIPHPQKARSQPHKSSSNSVTKFSVTCNGIKSFSACKREHEDAPVPNCDLLTKSSICNNECQSRSSCSSGANSECSDVSDLLHSAHTTMYQIDGMNSMDSVREFQQTQVSISCDSNTRNTSPFNTNVTGQTSFSASYSMSSILDMPSCRIKSEPENKNSASHPSHFFSKAAQQISSEDQCTSHSTFIYNESVGSRDVANSNMLNNASLANTSQKSETSGNNSNNNKIIKTEDGCGKAAMKGVIIIEDTDESSDDEPLARLVKCRSCDNLDQPSTGIRAVDIHIKIGTNIEPKQCSQNRCIQQSKISAKEKNQHDGDFTKLSPDCYQSKILTTDISNSKSTENVGLKPQCDSLLKETQTESQDCVLNEKDTSPNNRDTKKLTLRKISFGSSPKAKKPANKTKAWPAIPHKLNTNHGWSWIGEGQMKPIPKVTQVRDEPVRIRKCYQSMQHTSGEIVSVRDCVILQSEGDRKIPYVAKVSALWDNLDGEMMFSMLWYYQPEHTAAGREPEDGDQELFASKHREENGVACIDDKCFVLMYNEYCRLEAEGVRMEQGVSLPRWRELMPDLTADDKELCRLPPPAYTCAENIWFCRYDYDVRKKIVKKSKHKRSNLRYREPCKMT